MLERECNPHVPSKGSFNARESASHMAHASRASKSERVQGTNHRFRDCRQIELVTEASKRDRVQTTDSETIDTVKLSR
jgi:hypothetical protein